MGWSISYDGRWKRDIGYGVPAWCDHPDCSEVIDRGLAFVCGGEPWGGDDGCGLFFCPDHRSGEPPLCHRCANGAAPFNPKPERAEWLRWKLADGSWGEWRDANPGEVAAMQSALAEIGGGE